MNRLIGLHLRLTDSFIVLMNAALSLHLPFFQSFGIHLPSNKLYEPSMGEHADYIYLRRKHFKELYFHASYWINLCRATPNLFHLIYREIDLAVSLEFTHFVIHPGAYFKYMTYEQGIEQLVNHLQKILDQKFPITLVLENTAHGSQSIGSNIADFMHIKKQLGNQPIKFCIDTAHAFVYGYQLATDQGRASFISLLNQTIGVEAIQLLHVNDTNNDCGSRVDNHEIPGHGIIGSENLKALVNSNELKNIPMLVEPPHLHDIDLVKVVSQLQSW